MARESDLVPRVSEIAQLSADIDALHVLVAKRLEKSSFRWPRIADGVMRLTSSQLSALLEGLDWTRVRAVRVAAPQATL